MLLGNKLGDKSGTISSRLYSEYPFPWRVKDGGLNDDFSLAAWLALQGNPNEPYFRFETIDGHTVLRYVTADMMRESCVDCHK
ncbi:MAG: hypothetical protein HRU22_09665 [Gammaproteobacteria bacterium]|nr:hypothetical protein [Gammaproteobacteria bacterium]